TETQSELFADDWKNEIGVRVRQVEHFLATVAEAKPVYSAAAQSDQRLHLLQTGVLFETFRIEKSGQAAHTFRHLRGDKENAAQTCEGNQAKQDRICPSNEHHDECRRAEQSSGTKIDFKQDQREKRADD